MRILLIDDDEALLNGLAEMVSIRLAPVTVDMCQSSASAVDLVERGHYDLILCDVWMPEMDKLALLPQLRHIAPDARIVMMSGALDGSARTRALEQGATAFVPKPFNRDVLTATLKQALQKPRSSETPFVPRAAV